MKRWFLCIFSSLHFGPHALEGSSRTVHVLTHDWPHMAIMFTLQCEQFSYCHSKLSIHRFKRKPETLLCVLASQPWKSHIVLNDHWLLKCFLLFCQCVSVLYASIKKIIKKLFSSTKTNNNVPACLFFPVLWLLSIDILTTK